MGEPSDQDFSWVEIGRRIRDWRLARGWSQQQLAQMSRMSQSGVVHLEKGDTNPQLNTLRVIAAAFGKPLRELMFGALPQARDEHALLNQRIVRILESEDKAAHYALECGVKVGELLLDRRSAIISEQQEIRSAAGTSSQLTERDVPPRKLPG